jgi:hypothetical protein
MLEQGKDGKVSLRGEQRCGIRASKHKDVKAKDRTSGCTADQARKIQPASHPYHDTDFTISL